MPGADADRLIAQDAVEAALRALAQTSLKPETESMLRVFLAFKAIARDQGGEPPEASSIKATVQDILTVIPTPEGVADRSVRGTIRLRGSKAKPQWLSNDSHRGSITDYAGPSGAGRFMFVDEDWRKPMLPDAVQSVLETFNAGSNNWPPRQALAAIVLRNHPLDPALDWEELVDLTRERLGLSIDDWERVTSPRELGVAPFYGPPWDHEQLSPELLPAGVEAAKSWVGHPQSAAQLALEQRLEELPLHLASQVRRVEEALRKFGARAIVALAGVPGTSKSHVARIAAREFADEGCLREIQFSPSYTYEEFMEGPRYGENMKVEAFSGVFLDLNQSALEHPTDQYVLLVEELTRADLPRVLGELLTYIEYRGEGDQFTTIYSRDSPTRIAPNLAILATYNPSDRSAVNVDAALIRRMRILDFPPNMQLLEEMLGGNEVKRPVALQLVTMFEACREVTGPDRYEETMPFGHAIFAAVHEEADLYELWHETIKRILIRPHAPRHELYDTILEHFPWHAAPDRSVLEQQMPGNVEGADS